jgi:hypothetical protein
VGTPSSFAERARPSALQFILAARGRVDPLLGDREEHERDPIQTAPSSVIAGQAECGTPRRAAGMAAKMAVLKASRSSATSSGRRCSTPRSMNRNAEPHIPLRQIGGLGRVAGSLFVFRCGFYAATVGFNWCR